MRIYFPVFRKSLRETYGYYTFKVDTHESALVKVHLLAAAGVKWNCGWYISIIFTNEYKIRIPNIYGEFIFTVFTKSLRETYGYFTLKVDTHESALVKVHLLANSWSKAKKKILFVSCNSLKINMVGRSVKFFFFIILLVKNVCLMHVLRWLGVGRVEKTLG